MHALILTLGFIYPGRVYASKTRYVNAVSKNHQEVANVATNSQLEVSGHAQQPIMELNPAYRFHCVWQEARQPALASWTRAEWAEALDIDRGDSLYADPCLLGLTKLCWAVILTGLS